MLERSVGDHRQPGAGDEDAGQRVPRLRAPAGGAASTPIDLNALVQRGARRCTARRRRAGRLHAELGAGLPAIVGDGTQLRQVIHNLVQNALDAVAERPDGRVRVVTEVGAQRSGRSARRAPAAWSTTGPGFSEKVLQARLRALRHDQDARAPASASRWSRRSPTSTARACASPTWARRARRRRRRAGSARGASFAIIFQTRPGGGRASPRTSRGRDVRGALRRSWPPFLSSTTNWAFARCCRRSSPTKVTRSSWPRTRRRRAPAASACAPTSCCSTSGCPMSTASRCSRSGARRRS